MFLLLLFWLFGATLIIWCLSRSSRWHHLSFDCLFWFFLNCLIFITLVWWPRELLFRCVTPGNSTISILLFFVLSYLKYNWLLLLLWFLVSLRFLIFLNNLSIGLLFLYLLLFFRCVTSRNFLEFRMRLINSASRDLVYTFRSGFTSKLFRLDGSAVSWGYSSILLRLTHVEWLSFLTLWVHLDEGLRVNIDTERDQFLIVVINWVKMLQEKVTEKEISVVMLIERVLGNSELTNFLTLVEISSWAQVKYRFSNLETNRLNKFSNLGAALKTLAESCVSFAIQIWEIFPPWILKNMILLWRHSQERASSINHSRVSLGLLTVLKGLSFI